MMEKHLILSLIYCVSSKHQEFTSP